MGSCFEERTTLTKEKRNKGNNSTNAQKINTESALNESQNENTGLN